MDFTAKNIVSIEEAKALVDKFKDKRAKIGLCAGCFDLVHPGHVAYFETAKKTCDVLFVAVSNDKFVNLRKGPGRPILSASLNAYQLAQLRVVNYVLITPYDRATELIKLLKPDYYVKNKEYENQNTPGIIEERKAVKKVKGKMLYVDSPKLSTSEIIKHIQDKCRKQKVLLVLDRDGTLIELVNWLGKDNNWIDQVKLRNDVISLIYYAQKTYEVTSIVVTNQAGVARKFFNTTRVEEVNSYVNELLEKNNIKISKWKYCPDIDSEFATTLGDAPDYNFVRKETNRKPSSNLVNLALDELGKKDFDKIIVVGDSGDDEGLALNIKARFIDVRKGGLKTWMKTLND